jgi:hypothetical protein
MVWRGSLTALLITSALGIAAAAEPTVSSLTKQLESGSTNEQVSAAESLGNMGPRAASAVPQLVKLLSNDDLGVKLEAAIALGRINSEASVAVPALIGALSDSKTPILQQSAIDSLRRESCLASTSNAVGVEGSCGFSWCRFRDHVDRHPRKSRHCRCDSCPRDWLSTTRGTRCRGGARIGCRRPDCDWPTSDSIGRLRCYCENQRSRRTRGDWVRCRRGR